MLSGKDKEIILDDLDITALLGQCRFNSSKSPAAATTNPELIYERKSKEELRPDVFVLSILKNEAKIVIRMLQSTLPWTKGCVILDTGCTDGTVDAIKEFMETHDWTGKIYRRPFAEGTFEFDVGRNMLLDLAHCYGKWHLLSDGDYVWSLAPTATARFYDQDPEVDVWLVGTSDNVHWRPHLVRSHVKFQYTRKAHEYTDWHQAGVRMRPLEDLILHDIGDGGCKQDKYLRDTILLKKDPEDSRFYFYYGSTLQNLGPRRIQLAMENLTKRIHCPEGGQEVYLSRFRRTQMMVNNLGYPMAVWLQEALEAFLYCPSRLDALHLAMTKLLELQEPLLAASIGSLAYKNATGVAHKGLMFVSKGVHDSGFWLVLADAALKSEDPGYRTAGFVLLRERMIQGKIDSTDLLHCYLDYYKGHPEANRQVIEAILNGTVDKLELPYTVRFRQGSPIAMTVVDRERDLQRDQVLAGIKDRKAKDLEAKKASWLALVLDAIKLSIGSSLTARSLSVVRSALKGTAFENLIGVFFRIAFPG